MADAELKAPENTDGTVHTFHIMKDDKSIASLKPEALQDPDSEIQTFFLEMEKNGLLDQISEVLENSGLSQGELRDLSDFFKNTPGFEAIGKEVNDFANSRGADSGGAEIMFGAADRLTIGSAFNAVAPGYATEAMRIDTGATPTAPHRTA